MSFPASSRPPGPTPTTLPCCGGNDDAAGSLGLGIDALDDNTVVQRAEFHRYLLVYRINFMPRRSRSSRPGSISDRKCSSDLG
jgi:hypothetical protein